MSLWDIKDLITVGKECQTGLSASSDTLTNKRGENCFPPSALSKHEDWH